MITAFFITLVKIIAVVVILAAMVAILLGIHHLSNPTAEEISQREKDIFRRQVREDSDVVSDHSLFYRFLARDGHGRRGYVRRESGGKE